MCYAVCRGLQCGGDGREQLSTGTGLTRGARFMSSEAKRLRKECECVECASKREIDGICEYNISRSDYRRNLEMCVLLEGSVTEQVTQNKSWKYGRTGAHVKSKGHSTGEANELLVHAVPIPLF
ncbi:hypothetical protein EVAR_25203_1 [Eumeta japonica]|uniref:Uncharacterized protein n=1 Tax=Eumeta variegata TaxID=151549 RepID=A0A4C1WGE8_EUMVA|nr:hypothetical protein EVAR_25203_1 [Eumeta japonica]